MFPVADWATYALAMTTLGCGLVICWLIALRVVDRRRAFFVVVMLALYPIFNFKGFKYNPDLLQLVTLPLVVLAYLNAFEKRSARSGLWLGLAGALALMTKYWVLTMIGAIGIAALIHPDRLKFLRSPAPWVAIVDARRRHDPASGLAEGSRLRAADLCRRRLRPAEPRPDARSSCSVISATIWRCSRRRWRWRACAGAGTALVAAPRATLTRVWSRGANPGVNASQALNIWIIQIVVAIGPPLGALFFAVYMKTDWGISLFFLTPLALVAIPALRLQRIALFDIAAIWLCVTLATLAASPTIAVARDGRQSQRRVRLWRAFPTRPRTDARLA